MNRAAPYAGPVRYAPAGSQEDRPLCFEHPAVCAAANAGPRAPNVSERLACRRPVIGGGKRTCRHATFERWFSIG